MGVGLDGGGVGFDFLVQGFEVLAGLVAEGVEFLPVGSYLVVVSSYLLAVGPDLFAVGPDLFAVGQDLCDHLRQAFAVDVGPFIDPLLLLVDPGVETEQQLHHDQQEGAEQPAGEGDY